ncbi:MAG: hypothetical protein ACI9DF_003568 [Verrucomicrobiales bacterium]|jgi:hypothetical protein
MEVMTVSDLAEHCLPKGLPRVVVDGNLPGTIFHNIVEKFINVLTGPDGRALTDAEVLWFYLHDHLALTEVQDLIHESPTRAVGLCDALRAFCHHTAALHLPNQPWSQLLQKNAYPMHNVQLGQSQNGPFLVNGRIDNLRCLEGRSLQLVDYKLSRGTKLQRDVIQLAIYCRCLLIKDNLRVDGVLEYYEPELHEIMLPYDQLEQVFEDVVRPKIEEL